MTVVFLGEINEHKGAFLLLDAWRQLADQPAGDRAELVLVGGGAVDEARARVRELGIADRVRVTGWMSPDEVRDLMRRAHVLALPSKFEGQPMAVLEAMAHGQCVVATDVGGVRELVGDCGVLLPRRDAASLAEALLEVVRDSGWRAELGRRAHRRVQERFDVNHTWRALDDIYQELTQ